MKHTATARHITFRIEKSSEGRYLPIPFEVGEGVERIDLRYRYGKNRTETAGGVTFRYEDAVIDLALNAPGGDLAGSSGSDRDHVWVSPLGSSAGFDQRSIRSGTWEIIAGAYKVPPEGIEVEYDLTFTLKSRRLFKGDTHVHSIASDGSATASSLADTARQLGLDFIFLTDHNNYAQNYCLPPSLDVTIIPGCEWTHYQGHAGFLGVNRPFEGSYCTTSLEETAALFAKVQKRGVLLTLNHPFCPLVPWKWGFDLPYDAVEVWNGVMSERNERAAGWWHAQLAGGRRLPVTGGSDYHRPGLLGSVGMPSHCVWAPSREPADIMAALRNGSGYISYLPDGPGLDVLLDGADAADSGAACLGTEVPSGAALDFHFFGLKGSDTIRILTAKDTEIIQCEDCTTELLLHRSYRDTPFVRAELYRVYAPGLPPMKALLSNPVYFSKN